MKATSSPDMCEPIYQTTWCHIYNNVIMKLKLGNIISPTPNVMVTLLLPALSILELHTCNSPIPHVMILSWLSLLESGNLHIMI